MHGKSSPVPQSKRILCMSEIFMEKCVRCFYTTDVYHWTNFIWLVVVMYYFIALPSFLKTLSFLLVIFAVSSVNKFPTFFSMWSLCLCRLIEALVSKYSSVWACRLHVKLGKNVLHFTAWCSHSQVDNFRGRR